MSAISEKRIRANIIIMKVLQETEGETASDINRALDKAWPGDDMDRSAPNVRIPRRLWEEQVKICRSEYNKYRALMNGRR